MTVKILHTSDIHIGRRLKNKDRYEEFRKFFTWLEALINHEDIHTLLISGDVFDNSTPSVQSQNIYYSFLARLTKSTCKNVVIISGNHDSPAFLDAPAELLKALNIHVVGVACENIQDEIITLYNSDSMPEVIICAVPYLRDRDVRTACEDLNDTGKILISGIYSHYAKVFEHAKILRGNSNIPVVAMGHLFVHGGHTAKDDGTRALYVGTAIEVGSDLFPEYVSYTALGHLHSQQFIGRENIRYSGSPLAMGFGEAAQKKCVNIVEIDDLNNAHVKNVTVPEFQRITKISGSIDEIFERLEALEGERISVWVEVDYTGSEISGQLQEMLNEFTKSFRYVEILSIHDESKTISYGTSMANNYESLENISPVEMLELCFDANDVSQEQRKILMPLYHEILGLLEIDY